MQCIPFPDSDNAHAAPRLLFNPMSEYINRHGEDDVQASFDAFKRKHGHNYKDEHEHRHRLKTFRHNHRYVNARNRAGLTYKMKLNKFADRTVTSSLPIARIARNRACLCTRTKNCECYEVVDTRKVTTAGNRFPSRSSRKAIEPFPTRSIGVSWAR